jgi:hypothetical protein
MRVDTPLVLDLPQSRKKSPQNKGGQKIDVVLEVLTLFRG